ncbi:MAG TPA: hypothetical protein VHH73_04305 [Verrucomicrobiae bacterium]|nr:hypothetical protein [Verrucomicrobiae bacterium]
MNAKMKGMLPVICAGLLMAGCATEVGGSYEVYDAPPPPQVEVIPVSPGPNYVWVGGHWGWHNRWTWEPGHYYARPHARAVWVDGRWNHGRRGYHYSPGHWR